MTSITREAAIELDFLGSPKFNKNPINGLVTVKVLFAHEGEGGVWEKRFELYTVKDA